MDDFREGSRTCSVKREARPEVGRAGIRRRDGHGVGAWRLELEERGRCRGDADGCASIPRFDTTGIECVQHRKVRRPSGDM